MMGLQNYEYTLLKMSLFSASPNIKTQKLTQKMPHRTTKATANLQVQWLSRKTRVEYAKEFREKREL
jgi:hypothetical protein